MELFLMLASMLGGLVMFLYGMNVMSDTLSQMAGGSLNRALGKITKNKFSGWLAGTALTAVVQSSSATTVLTVGFVNGGIIKLKDAVGLVIGANLGTTMTAWILSLNSIQGGGAILQLFKPTTFVPFVALAGFLAMSLGKKTSTKRVGTALVGFGIMMTGMNLMSSAMAPLRELPAFQSLLGGLTNPFIAFLVALLITMLIQSSDATVGILQAIAVSGGFTLGMAIPMVCGAQVGSCITALISSMGTSNNGKRTALLHLYYNLLKTVPFLIILYALNAAFHFPIMNLEATGAEIPIFHTAINLLGSAVFLPLSNLIVKLAELTVPYTEKEQREKEDTLTMLDSRLLKNPEVAGGQVKTALLKLSEAVSDGYGLYLQQKNPDAKKKEEMDIVCTRISRYTNQIQNYLTEISAKIKGDIETKQLERARNICTAFGNMGEILGRAVAFQERILSEGKHFSEEAIHDMRLMGQSAQEMIELTVTHMQTENLALADTVSLIREELGLLLAMINNRHIKRVHDGICDESLSTPFIDICYTFDKVVDACDTVAHNFSGKTRDAGSRSKKDLSETVKKLYHDKFLALSDGKALPENNN